MNTLDRIYGYFDRQIDLRVLFIFDEMRILEAELSTVQWKDGFIYKVFNGEAFQIKYALEHEWKESKLVLLVPQHSPQSDDDYANFPLLDILRANTEYKGESTEFFLQEKNIPTRLRNYIENNLQKLQLKMVDKVLAPHYNADLSEDILNRGIISAYLDANTLLEWTAILTKVILLSRESEADECESFVSGISKSKEAVAALESKAEKVFGYKISMASHKNYFEMFKWMACSLKYNSLCCLLPLSRVDSYCAYKVKSNNSIDQINAIWDYACGTPAIKDDFDKTIKEVACSIQEEKLVQWYGESADYFRFTEELCNLVISELVNDKIYAEPAEVGEKVRDMQQKNDDEHRVLEFVGIVCDYYDACDKIKTIRLNTPSDYIQKYVSEFYLLDSYYRKAIECFTLARGSAIGENLRCVKEKLDLDYAKFCNMLNLEWTDCLLSDKDGLDGIGTLRQQDFYERCKKEDVKQVVIVSDALRYEVGAELVKAMSVKAIHAARIDYALAMLPTETKYCKPSLLPHRQLSLEESESNLLVDGTVCNSTDLRTAQIESIVPNACCVQYSDVIKNSEKQNRELFKKPLVYIMHDTIDNDGHDCDADKLTAACRKCVEDLSKLVPRLHATFNVSHVSIVSDHGFLFNDIEFQDKDKHVVEEDSLEKKSRYYLTKSKADINGIVKFPLSKVSGINRNDIYVAVPRGTNRLAAMGGGYQFAHGGCALQEIVIPVIHSNFRRDISKQKVGMRILTYKQSESKLVMNSSLLRFRLMPTEAVDSEHKERRVVCAVYYKGEPLTEEKEILLNSTSQNPDERCISQELLLAKPTEASILELRVYDVDDKLNPIATSTVTNNTLIERDF